MLTRLALLWYIALRVTKWGKPEGERNQKDQHTNTAVDQAHVASLRNGQAAKQCTHRAGWPGRYSDEGDDAPKQRVGNDTLGHAVGTDQKKNVYPAAQGPDHEDRWIPVSECHQRGEQPEYHHRSQRYDAKRPALAQAVRQ